MSTYSAKSRKTKDEDDLDEKDDTKRKSRNLSEKKRRDQFNMLVSELSTMVSTGARKMDKSTVLKSTIAFLKNHNELLNRSQCQEIQEEWKPSFVSNEEFTHLILEALDGFVIVFSTTGKIFYASESISALLGYLPGDLLHSTMYDLILEEEHQTLYHFLSNPNRLNSQEQSQFYCHIKHGRYEQQPVYEFVHFMGYFRSDVDLLDSNSKRFFGFSIEADTRLLFVGIGRLHTPQLIRELSILDTSSDSEFTSRHSLEWKFLFLDHRAPPIIGYLPFEVLGTSGYDYYHVDDLENVVACHEALMQKGECTSGFYRFLTKGQQWLWLQTRFYITYHQWTSKPEFIVCTHRVISYSDVLKKNRKEILNETHDSAYDIQSSQMVDSQNTQNSSDGMVQSTTWTTRRRQSNNSDSTNTLVSNSTKSTQKSRSTRDSGQSHPPRRSSHNGQEESSISLTQIENFNLQDNASCQQQQQTTQQDVASEMTPVLPGQPPPQYLTLQRAQYPQQNQIEQLQISPLELPSQQTGVTGNNQIPISNADIQLQLQRKREELQQSIDQQQQELRRISEQLLMAQLGILPNNITTNGSRGQQNSPTVTHQTNMDIENQNIIKLQYPQNSTNLISTTVAIPTAFTFPTAMPTAKIITTNQMLSSDLNQINSSNVVCTQPAATAFLPQSSMFLPIPSQTIQPTIEYTQMPQPVMTPSYKHKNIQSKSSKERQQQQQHQMVVTEQQNSSTNNYRRQRSLTRQQMPNVSRHGFRSKSCSLVSSSDTERTISSQDFSLDNLSDTNVSYTA